jgi:hypothetical protein
MRRRKGLNGEVLGTGDRESDFESYYEDSEEEDRNLTSEEKNRRIRENEEFKRRFGDPNNKIIGGNKTTGL